MAQQQDDCGQSSRPCPQPGRLAFAGERIAGSTRVTVTQAGQASQALPLHLEIRNHSPTGFEWGYGGSGPAQLALALCVEVAGRHRAERWYQFVKDRLVATINDDAWMMSGLSVLDAIEQGEQSDQRSTRSA